MPASRAPNCFKDSLEFVSLSNSGKTDTIPMCKKPPAVNGRIQLVLDSGKHEKNFMINNIRIRV